MSTPASASVSRTLPALEHQPAHCVGRGTGGPNVQGLGSASTSPKGPAPGFQTEASVERRKMGPPRGAQLAW
eukprot:12889512-Prorocentrum_lima.AAC.1